MMRSLLIVLGGIPGDPIEEVFSRDELLRQSQSNAVVGLQLKRFAPGLLGMHTHTLLSGLFPDRHLPLFLDQLKEFPHDIIGWPGFKPTEKLLAERIDPKKLDQRLLAYLIPKSDLQQLNSTPVIANILINVLAQLYTFHNYSLKQLKENQKKLIITYFPLVHILEHEVQRNQKKIEKNWIKWAPHIHTGALRILKVLSLELVKTAGPETNSCICSMGVGMESDFAYFIGNNFNSEVEELENQSHINIVPTLIEASNLLPNFRSDGNPIRKALATPPQKAPTIFDRNLAVPELQTEFFQKGQDLQIFQQEKHMGTALMDLQQFDRALPHLACAAYLHPEDAENAMHLANCCFNLGLFQEAKGHLQAIWDSSPKNPQALILLAWIEFYQGNIKISEELLAKIINADGLPAPLKLQAGLLWLRLNHSEKAFSLFKATTEQMPYNPIGWLGLGRTYLDNKQLDDAEEWTQYSLSLQKNQALAYLTLAQIQQAKGAIEKSKKHIQEAIQHEPLLAQKKEEIEKLFATATKDPQGLNDFIHEALSGSNIGQSNEKLDEFREQIRKMLLKIYEQWNTVQEEVRKEVEEPKKIIANDVFCLRQPWPDEAQRIKRYFQAVIPPKPVPLLILERLDTGIIIATFTYSIKQEKKEMELRFLIRKAYYELPLLTQIISYLRQQFQKEGIKRIKLLQFGPESPNQDIINDGFRHLSRKDTWNLDLLQLHQRLHKLRYKLDQRGKLPQEFRIRPLEESDVNACQEILKKQNLAPNLQAFELSKEGISSQISSVIIRNEKICGCLLASELSGQSKLEACVIDEGFHFQETILKTRLLLAFCEKSLQKGVRGGCITFDPIKKPELQRFVKRQHGMLYTRINTYKT